MASLKDVAERAGVSICTASRVLGGRYLEGRISRACAARVLEVAREIGYRPNYHARSLRRGRARAVGLLLERPTHGLDSFGFWGQMIAGVDIEARLRGYDFLVVGAGADDTVADAGLRYLRERRVDCLVVPGYLYFARTTPELHRRDVNAVLVEYQGRTPLPVVELDDAAGIAAAVRRLAELGHREILWLSPREARHPSVGRRREAFFRTAGELGLAALDCPADARGDSAGPEGLVEAGHDALLAELRRGVRASAVVCYDEPRAFGAYAALAEFGLRIPEDVSVVGFDDIHARVARPPMTVVSHMLGELGRRAAALAIEMATDEKARARLCGKRVKIPAELVERGSIGPAMG